MTCISYYDTVSEGGIFDGPLGPGFQDAINHNDSLGIWSLEGSRPFDAKFLHAAAKGIDMHAQG